MKTSQLATLYEALPPFASATVDVSHDSENGEHEHQLRVRAACDALTQAGADPAAVDAVSERLGQLVKDPAPVARTVVATGEGIVFDQVMHTQVDQPEVTWGPLPDVSRWVQHQDSVTTFVLAVVDHEGGDVALYDSDVPEPHDEATVGGETNHVHKVPVGGWSALRYQHVTENVWTRNAEAVADEAVSHVRAGHRLVLLAGDPQSRPIVAERLSDTPATVVQLSTGTRAQDGSDEATQQAIREALMAHATERRLETSHTLKDRLGRDDAVATGLADVADAFVRGQVDTLLLDPPAAAGLELDPGRHPGLALGTAPLDEPLRADLALVAAATLTGADIVVSRASAMGGTPVAALLRWDQDGGTPDAGGRHS
jgi:hypothetical protein